jgi:hyperosmotically inducible periplasmic protein
MCFLRLTGMEAQHRIFEWAFLRITQQLGLVSECAGGTRARSCAPDSSIRNFAMYKLPALKIFVFVALCASILGANAQSSPVTDASSVAAGSPSARKADRALGRSVRRAIDKAQGVDVSKIFVKARNGAVTLSGTVPDAAQIPLASTVAQSVKGVASVSNALTVQALNGGN